MTVRLRSMIDPIYLTEMVEMAKATPVGCFVEVGVYRGGSAQYLYEVAESQGRTLHLFDTFSGMPHAGELDGWRVGELMPVADDFIAIVKALPNAKIYQGVFPETLPIDFPQIAFVHADADQYQSTKAICESLYPRLVPGGIILFDDYGDEKTKGCTKAVDEFVAQLPFGCFKRSPRYRAHIQRPFSG